MPEMPIVRDALITAADAAAAEQLVALLQLARRQQAAEPVFAVRGVMRELLDDSVNGRDSLAAGVAILVVAADRGELPGPAGTLPAPAGLLVQTLDTLERVGCQFDQCKGPTINPADMITCYRCENVALLRALLGMPTEGEAE